MTAYADRERELLEKIRSRANVEVEVRPTRFDVNRIGRSHKLLEIVQRSQVALGGWHFPYISQNPEHHEFELAPDWVGHAFQWEHQIEVWRLFRSGLFFGVLGIPYEWRDESGWWPQDSRWAPNKLLGVDAVIDICTWTYEFAARLSNSLPGEDAIVVNLSFNKMAGRTLTLDRPNRAPLFENYTASTEVIPTTVRVERSRLLADPYSLAVDAARQIFDLFQWEPPEQLLRDLQAESASRQRR